MKMKRKITFASDNASGAHPAVLAAINKANKWHEISYGEDSYTPRAISLFKNHFGKNAEVFFVFNGTAANVLALKALTEPHNSIICAKDSHMDADECGAPERFTGCKLATIETSDGKLTVAQIKEQMHGIGFQHAVQPKVVSITQPTEYGTLYTIGEMRGIAAFAHRNGMYLHVDGARFSNAAAALWVSLKGLSAGTGVDALSFGGTKNGMMYGEAVIFFNKKLAKDFQYTRKQGMQLASKMRFISAQFIALLYNNLWLKNAQHSNSMAKLLESELSKIPEVKITQKVEANAVFAILPKKCIPI